MLHKIKIKNICYCALQFLEDDYSRLASNIGEEKDTEVASTPYFDLDNSGNVTAVLGKTAYLNCRVKNIKNQTVSIFYHLVYKKSPCFLMIPLRYGSLLLKYFSTLNGIEALS